jgi:hypothetical protein
MLPFLRHGPLTFARYLLNDFSMTLATIITSMENFIDPKALREGEDSFESMEFNVDSDDEDWDDGDGLASPKYDGKNQAIDVDEAKDFEKDMRHVHRMFKALQQVFETRFRQMWA